MNWRATQLNWYNGDTIQQDYELEKFVSEKNISTVEYLGDSDYLKDIIGKESSPGELCVFIVNHLSKLSDVVNVCNNHLSSCRMLYLSLNKFLLDPEPQDVVTDDYDNAIYEYVIKNVNAALIKYHSGKIDQGIRFNWVHPLTRFYFYNENTFRNT